VEPEKTSTARQRLGKQLAASTDPHVTIEELLVTMFPVRYVQGVYKEEFR
jgi:hypothetical protein